MPPLNTSLRLQRRLRGWSQDDVARGLHRLAGELGEEVAGVDGNMVSRWERGVRRPRPRYVRLLCMLFELSPTQLGLVEDSPAVDESTPPAAKAHDSRRADEILGLKTWRVAIVEHRPLFRNGLAQVIKGMPGFVLAASTPSVEDLGRLGEPPADLVILNLDLPGLDVGAAIPALRNHGSRVLALVHRRTTTAYRLLRAGASGCVPDDAETNTLALAVRTVAQGSTYVSDDLGPEAEMPPLTSRELQIAGMVAEGLTNRQIAERLFISVRTAEGHLMRILDKLGVSSRTQIAVWFVN